MPRVELQQVCMNGHQVNSRFNECPQFSKPYCAQCGAPTLHQCPHCQAGIGGGFNIPVPWFCEKCGRPFPWTERSWERRQSPKQPKFDAVGMVEFVCKRFHGIAVQLRSRRAGRQPLEMVDEYDVQYLLNALLRMTFNDIRTEEWTPSYAGSSARMDFLLKEEQIVIEVKKSRETLGAREVGEQLIIDIEKYRVHPGCKILLCFVYDPDHRIVNPVEIERDLSRTEQNLIVKVLIEPRLA